MGKIDVPIVLLLAGTSSSTSGSTGPLENMNKSDIWSIINQDGETHANTTALEERGVEVISSSLEGKVRRT